MKIGIIGSGNIGGALGVKWAKSGHAVMFASRNPKALEPLAKQAGPSATTGTPDKAACFGDVILIATPFKAWPDLARDLGSLLEGKTVIDASNIYPQRDGEIAQRVIDAGEGSGAFVQALVPNSHVVKAFNTPYYKVLEDQGGHGIGLSVAGNDAGALAAVSELARDAGFIPVIAGAIERSKDFDPGAAVYAKALSRAGTRADAWRGVQPLIQGRLMKIGIFGAGNIGTGLGKRLAAKEHNIVVSFARTPSKVAEAARIIGGGANPGTPDEAAKFGDVVILATPWGVTLDTVRSFAPALAGKIVWDTTDPFAPDISELLIGSTTSAGEEIAKAAPGAKVVKAVPPFAEALHSPSMLIGGHKPGVFVCGDDAVARKTVVALVADVDADPFDAGPLKLARFTEPLGMLVTNLAYVQGFGPRIAAVLIRDAS